MTYILAIESAIGGGSITILKDGKPVAECFGTNSVSRSEDLLPNVKQLLADQSISISDIGALGISLGPGSYTGLRIGISTVLGLSRSLDIPIFGISALEAIGYQQMHGKEVLVALQASRTEIAWQVFKDGSSISEPVQTNPKEVFDHISAEAISTFVTQHSVIEWMDSNAETVSPQLNIVPVNENLSYYIAIAVHNGTALSDLKPLYIFNHARGHSLF